MSYFQALPELIIDKIIHFYFRGPECKWEAMSPLLWVCQSWRSAALQNLLDEYTINPVEEADGFILLHFGLYKPKSEISHWVKRLRLYVKLPAEWPFLDNMVVPIFSNVWSLAIYIELSSLELDDGGLSSSKIIEKYTQDVRLFAPNATSVSISVKYQSKDSTSQQAKDQLSQFLISVAFNVNELTRIYFKEGSLPAGFDIVCKNARTLQVLGIREYTTFGSFSELIFEKSTGEFMVYPNMRHLKIVILNHRESYKMLRPKSPGAVPFPYLQNLECPGGYPFGDDVLFRGNQHTLRSINIMLCLTEVSILTEYRVFAADTHPNLHYVSVESMEDNAIKTIYSMARHVQVFKLVVPLFGEEPRNRFIANVGSLETLRVLDLFEFPLAFDYVVTVIESLSCLEKLRCRCFTYANFSSLDALIAKKSPISHSLKELQLLNNASTFNEHELSSIITLAILCPSFYLITLMSNNQEKSVTWKRWKVGVKEEKYEKYASKLDSIKIIFSV